MADIERQIGGPLPEANQYITIHQRRTIGFVTIARTLLRSYPRRSVLGFALYVGQAFLYNAVTLGFAQNLETFFKVPSGCWARPGCSTPGRSAR